MQLHGPFEIDVKVHVTDGENEGVVTYSLPPGVFPSAESVRKALEESEKGAKKAGGEGFRLATKSEFVNTLLADHYGATEKFAIPGGDEWDDPEAEGVQ